MAEEWMSQKDKWLKEHGKFNIEVTIEYNEIEFMECYFPAEGENIFETLEEAKEGAKAMYARHRAETIEYMDEQEAKIALLNEENIRPMW